jgi:hypothetical protein
MFMIRSLATPVAVIAVLGLTSCSETKATPAADPAPVTVAPAGVPAAPPLTKDEVALYREMARLSWSYLDKYYQSSTGFVNATPEWANTTVWDIGGQILAFLAAKELGLLPPAEFHRRTAKTLTTLEKAPLFRDAAYSKLYTTTTGTIGDARAGWSATDLGRLLVALKVLSVREPQHAAQAERVAKRNDYTQIVKDGYVHGQLIGSNGKPWTFQEGRIGYEQYVARGFDAWGENVNNALSLKTNAVPDTVLGVEIMRDKRWQDRLLSEPFILYGIELGMPADVQGLAVNVLKAQEARYKQTGTVTIASEDALSVKPHYFYYYCVFCNGKPFVIDISTPGKEMDSPRWVSTKGAFGWHALFPGEYTKTAIDYVTPAKDPKKGWSSGVFEGSRESTNTHDINTAAVLMEIAYYQLRGRKPMIEPGPVTN